MNFIRKWKPILQSNYQQLLFVFLAFLTMIAVVFISVTAVSTQQLAKSSNETLRTVEATINANLREPEATLVNCVFTIRNMIETEDATQEEVLQYMTRLTDWLMENKTRVSGFNGIYGVVRAEYLDGMGWVPPPGYVPVERPWYLATKDNGGEISFTEPYIDAQTSEVIISYSEEIIGSDQQTLGVIAIDVLLNAITDYVCSLQLTEGGYGMLMDQNLNIMAHPNQTLLGQQLHQLSADFSQAADRLWAGRTVSGMKVTDSEGIQRLVFVRQLYNGWYVALLTPIDSYYRDMYRMEAGLSILGTALMLALCCILLRLSAAKLQSEEENRSKSSFLARISHEIRTPVKAMIGMTDLLRRRELPAAAQEDVLAIKQVGTNLLSTINDIVDFSRIETGRIQSVSESYQFAALMADVISIIRMRTIDKELLFTVNINSALPNILLGDEVRLRQILLNLLGNAVQDMRVGSISLAVDGEVKDDTVTLQIEIVGSGIGVLDSGSKQGTEEAGLGLVIAGSLCRQIGGDIRVNHEEDKGSVFTVALPQKIKEHTPFAAVEQPRQHRVLVYETREPYADSIIEAVRNLGVSCTRVLTGEELEEELSGESCTFLFVAADLLRSTQTIVDRLQVPVTLVLLAEFGENIVQPGIRSINMPVYSLSVANVLNGVAEHKVYTRLHREI